MRTWVRSMSSLSRLSIWRCCELWCRSQTWLGSCVAVALASSCSSVSPPSLGTSLRHMCPKKKKKKKSSIRSLTHFRDDRWQIANDIQRIILLYFGPFGKGRPWNTQPQTSNQTEGNVSQVYERGLTQIDFVRPEKPTCSMWHIIFPGKCWFERCFGESRRQSPWLTMKSVDHSGSKGLMRSFKCLSLLWAQCCWKLSSAVCW